MNTVEVTPIRRRDTRRLAKATVLLLAGMAVHVWLFPAPGQTALIASLAGRIGALTDEPVVATTGFVVPVPQASVGRAAPQSPAAPRRSDRVRVVIETVHPLLARPPIRSRPLEPGNNVRLSASVTPDQRFDPAWLLTVAEEEAPAGPSPSRAVEADAVSSSSAADRLEPIRPPAVSPARYDYPVVAAVRYEPRPAVSTPSDERLVTSVLQQYRQAYESLDVHAAQSVWPTVDARALSAAFRQLAGQRVTFDSCGVHVSGSGAQATARCKGQAEYVPKVGGRRAVVASGEWVFDLAKEDAAWRIINANAMIK